ncbi:SpoIIE family protein phosphatase [Streptomyces sp. NPDC046759]|uniref:SpoIIE family protein phosphatase n=1 Tax=Streptomyces sp. NPDC046759 TaxID=3155019 RepID=UPI0033F693AF
MEAAAHTAVCLDNVRRFGESTPPPQPFSGICWLRVRLHERAFKPPSCSSGTQGAGGCFDALSLPGARAALVIGEAAGQGIHAAATMGQVRTAVQTLVALDLEPDELLAVEHFHPDVGWVSACPVGLERLPGLPPMPGASAKRLVTSARCSKAYPKSAGAGALLCPKSEYSGAIRRQRSAWRAGSGSYIPHEGGNRGARAGAARVHSRVAH